MNNSFFAQRLRQALSDADMKAADLCRICDIKKSTMSQYLSGKYTAKHDRILAMARALGCSPDWLMGMDVPQSPVLADGGAMGLVPVLLPDASNLTAPDSTVDYEPAEACYCDGRHYMYIADDDSMDPVIMEGDRVLCLQQDTLSNGQTGVFVMPDGRIAVRELQHTPSGRRLVCCNRYFPPYPIDEHTDVRIIGRVVRSTRYW